MKRRFIQGIIKSFFLLAFFTAFEASAQRSLPNISVKKFSNKVIISWLYGYAKTASVISIQRSKDSLRNFMTIGKVLNPGNRENGYIDARPPDSNMFYRVFIAYEGGEYLFSKVSRPEKATFTELDASDSAALSLHRATLVMPPPPPPVGRIYTGRENNVIIDLPDAEKKSFAVKFYEDSGKPVFEMNRIRDAWTVVDKTNFIHAGWFRFEIYDKGKLSEQGRFMLPRDNKVQSVKAGEKGQRY